MEIAAQLFTLRDYTQTPLDIYNTLKKVKAIGYNSIQVSAFGPIEPQLLKQYIDEIGLSICVTHTLFDRIVNDTENVINEHKLWGCEYIGLGAMPLEFRNGKQGYDNFLSTIADATDKIHSAGLKFMYHNHKFEFEKVHGNVNGMEYMAQNTDPYKFGFLADFFWVQAGGAFPCDFIEKYKDRIDVVHFKDMTVIDDNITMYEVGDGNMNYKAIYQSCINNGVKFAAVEQDFCNGKDPFLCMERSYKNLMSIR